MRRFTVTQRLPIPPAPGPPEACCQQFDNSLICSVVEEKNCPQESLRRSSSRSRMVRYIASSRQSEVPRICRRIRDHPA